MKPIADLHCHPSVKAILGTHTVPGLRAWKNYQFNLKLFGIIGNVDELFGDIIDSQSSLTQIYGGDGRLIFWVMYPFEKEYVEKNELQTLATRAKGINQELVDYYLEKKGNRRYVKKSVNYYDILVNEEFRLYNDTVNVHKLTRANSQLHPTLLNVALCIEGAHSFLSNKDKPGSRGGIKSSDYLQRVKDTFSNHSIYYLTLAHINPNGIFNGAYAGKLLGEEEMIKFVPRDYGALGITDLGWDVIDECIKHGVHPDVKHLSYRARIALYDVLDDMKSNGEKIIAPIATHMGVWGIPESKIESAFTQGASFEAYYYKDPGRHPHVLIECTTQGRVNAKFDTSFYPRTINLLDDDIIRIAKLGGIIGINMDERILGMGSRNDREEDFLTLQDFKWLCDRNGIDPYDYLIGNDDNEVIRNATVIAEPPQAIWPKKSPNNDEDCNGLPKSSTAEKHLKQFCYNVHHILDVLVENNIPTPWKFVCLGSDYDGLIDAVNCCKTFEDLPDFRDRVEGYFKKVHGFSTKYGITASHFADRFFYDNVRAFFGMS